MRRVPCEAGGDNDIGMNGDRKMSRVINDPELGEVVLRKSLRCRRISIRVHPVKGISVTMPYPVPYAVGRAFFLSRRDWVQSALMRQKKKLSEVVRPDPEDIECMRQKAKDELPARLAQLAAKYGFIYNKVTVKHNATNWGSCSSKGNINLNLSIMMLPPFLQDYILLHELCHLKHHDHGPAFHLLLEHVCSDHLLSAVGHGDQDALRLSRKIASSKARFPVDHVMTREIKAYRTM